MSRLVLLPVVLLALVPASARATLVFDREPLKPDVWVANDDGSAARKLAPGSQPRISPDGATVVFAHAADASAGNDPDLMAVPATGGAPRVLAHHWIEPFTFAWSPDGKTIATVLGPEIGPERLVLIDVATGARRTVAGGYVNGVSFAPDGTAIVYGRRPHSNGLIEEDLWRAAVAGGSPIRLTTRQRSSNPVWGPSGKVVYSRGVDATTRKYGPKSELYMMNPDGTGVKRLTRTKVDPLLYGLTPTQWSGDGTRLLAQFGGQDTTYAETVDTSTGKAKPLLKAEETGLIGTRLSADGSTVLGATGGFDPDGRHDVVTVPYAGGQPTVLARNAFSPDWTR